MTSPGPTPNDRALTLDRGLRLLKLLAATDDAQTVSGLALALGLHRQAVYRLLGTLEDHGLAQRSNRGGYRLGLAALALAGAGLPRLEDSVRPLLRELAETCAATAFLMAQEGDEAVTLLVAEPTHTSFHLAVRPGTRHTLTQGASGIAILAGHPARADDSDEVRRAREDGIAVSKEKITPGALGVAAPVPLPSATPAYASIGVIAMLEGADTDTLAHEVRAVARRLRPAA